MSNPSTQLRTSYRTRNLEVRGHREQGGQGTSHKCKGKDTKKNWAQVTGATGHKESHLNRLDESSLERACDKMFHVKQ